MEKTKVHTWPGGQYISLAWYRKIKKHSTAAYIKLWLPKICTPSIIGLFYLKNKTCIYLSK